MSENIERINQIPVAHILQALSIRYRENAGTFSLYEWNKMTSWWKANNDGIFTDFSGKWRASGDRITFIMSYLWCNKWKAISWFETTFNLPREDKKQKINPIKEKREWMPTISSKMEDYLNGRAISPSKVDHFVKNNNWKIALPIMGLKNWNFFIKSIQSRSIESEWWRYYVEANTDNSGVFVYNLDESKKALMVVEGFTDFLTLRQYTPNVVGLINAGNEGQLDIIKQLQDRYKIFFIPDNDQAGATTIKKFAEHWIIHNTFHLEHYWVKDINEFAVNFNIWEEILQIIFQESDRAKSSLSIAREKALEYKKMYDENGWKLGFSTIYPMLDKYTDWIIKWKVYMIMAYSNMGKTRFAYSFLKGLIDAKKRINFYSLEVDAWMLFIEMMWSLQKKSKQEVLQDIKNLNISPYEDFIEIHDSVRGMEAIENHIRQTSPEVAFIDFVQNIELGWSEYEKMTEIALRIQKLAILTGTSIFSLSQVNNESRFVEWIDALPKWSGALFASSDVIFTLRWKENKKFLTITKNKFWPAKKNFEIEVDYARSKFTLFEDFDDEAQQSKKTLFRK